jgi:hypothetical protein
MSRPAYKRHNFSPDSESIECRLCRRAFRTISISHVRYRHGIDLDDYRERFPKEVLTSEETKQRASETVSAHYELRGRHWTPERVRGTVKTLNSRGEPLNARAVFLSRKALYEAAYSFFGSFYGRRLYCNYNQSFSFLGYSDLVESDSILLLVLGGT